jgi:hypothetical protein
MQQKTKEWYREKRKGFEIPKANTFKYCAFADPVL